MQRCSESPYREFEGDEQQQWEVYSSAAPALSVKSVSIPLKITDRKSTR